jgi:hypothetical protein
MIVAVSSSLLLSCRLNTHFSSYLWKIRDQLQHEEFIFDVFTIYYNYLYNEMIVRELNELGRSWHDAVKWTGRPCGPLGYIWWPTILIALNSTFLGLSFCGP